MPAAMADSGSPTRATPMTCPVSPRMGPVQYTVVPDGSVLRKTYLSPWASLRPASTAATAGSDTNSPLDDGGGRRAVGSYDDHLSSLPVASGTPVVAAAARSVVSRAASTSDR